MLKHLSSCFVDLSREFCETEGETKKTMSNETQYTYIYIYVCVCVSRSL